LKTSIASRIQTPTGDPYISKLQNRYVSSSQQKRP
jgi:hypothetical protein